MISMDKSPDKSLVYSKKHLRNIDPYRQILQLLSLFAQREDNLESGLGFYELMPILLSLFLEKDQLIHKDDKATFAKLCLKDKIDLIDNS